MKVIYVDMVGDLFHYGHVRFLKKAKNLGDFLIVGVHNDVIVKDYKRLPIMRMDERIEVIESCKYVDKIIPNAPLIITKEFIETNNIDIVCHAHSEEEEEKYNFMYKIPYELGIFKRFDYVNTISTTDIINKILN